MQNYSLIDFEIAEVLNTELITTKLWNVSDNNAEWNCFMFIDCFDYGCFLDKCDEMSLRILSTKSRLEGYVRKTFTGRIPSSSSISL